MRIEIYQDKKSEWRWRIKARNGRILCASSEGYKSRQGCEKCLNIVADYWDEYLCIEEYSGKKAREAKLRIKEILKHKQEN